MKIRTWILISCIFPAVAIANPSIREKLSELHELRVQLRKAVFEKSRIKDELSRLQIEMDRQKERMQSLKVENQNLQERILNRVSALYKIHRLQPQGALFQLLGSHQFLKKSFYLNYLNQQDERLIQTYRDQQKTLGREQKQYQKRLAYFEKIKTSAQEKHQILVKQEAKQRELIRLIRQDLQTEGASSEKTPSATKVETDFFSEKRGRLRAPVPAAMNSRFGLRRDPKTDLQHLETGVYFSVTEKDPIQSVASGEVVYLEEIPGWGLTLILDHGEFFYTVYSHLKNPSVRLGERVVENQRLALVESSPYHKESRLYFEIRQFSEPQDPYEWIERGDL
ncbi:MAG: murein hydrolase activator EnvC family protein [Bdellovibrionales bacterium]